MKGFAATPIIFIAVFLITVMLFLHFMDMDKQVAEGIGKEARLRKLQAEVLKNQTAGANELYFCGVWRARYASDEITLEGNMSLCAGRSIDVIRGTNGFTAKYNNPLDYKSNILIDAAIEKQVMVSEHIDYPFFELVEAANNFHNEMNKDTAKCTDIANGKYDNAVIENNTFKNCTEPWFKLKSNIEWCGMALSLYSCGSGSCKVDYYIAGNRMPDTVSAKYWHQVDSVKSGLTCNATA